MRLEVPRTWLAWLAAAGMTALAWLGYQRPEMASALFNLAGFCM